MKDITFKEILRYYWPHIRVYKWPLAYTLLGFAIGGVLATAVTPLLFKQIIDITAGEVTNASLEHLMLIVALVAVSVIFENIFFRSADRVHAIAQSRIMKDLADNSFARLGDHAQSFFANTFVGSLVAKSKRYVDAYETLHDAFSFNIWMHGISFIATFSVLMWFAPMLAFIFIGWLVIYVLITVWFLRRQIPMNIEHAESQSTATGALADAISNVLAIKMFASFTREKAHYGEVTADQEQKRRRTWNWGNTQRWVQGLSVAIMQIAVISGAVILWSQGEITTGTIVLAQIYLFKLFDITWNIGRQIARVVQALNDAREMIEIFETPLSVADVVSPEPVRIEQGNIIFDNVMFKYQEGREIFSGLTLDIPSGQRVGLVGHSGAGKSTVTKLILRLTDIDSGVISIDGQDISAISQDDLRRNIAYVPQEPVLFHRSLRDNIAYGNPDATEEEIIEAAKRAHAHEFISTLKDGYDTLVGERGVKLSGGERQRVAIARALLKDAPILIMDEATSSLDSLSERYIQDALHELMEGRTTLVIAHRLSTIQDMDRILVFDKGEVIEDGSHTELIKNKKGTYHELWKEQSSGFLGE